MNHVNLLGIDIAKNVFQLHGIDRNGKATLKKRVSRIKLLDFLVNLPCCIVAMEACGGANYWARQIQKLGHEVKLISPQFVKPFVKSNKNDRNDAQAIAEAASRPDMRFVVVKTVEQQDIQCLHRIRERLIGQRTALMNQIRGFLTEYGLIIPLGQASLRRLILEFLEDAENELTAFSRRLIHELYDELLALKERIDKCDHKINTVFKENSSCQRIGKIEGVGPVTATAIISAIGDPRHFKNGRHYSAFLGLVPRQYSSGGRERLLGISKRGDKYLRKLLVHGARSVMLIADKKMDSKSLWIQRLKERRGSNRACIALANKNARIIWHLLANDCEYKRAA